jgi:uncharacterized protein YdcH (DUF465 family)
MQFDHHPFMASNPELQDKIHELKKNNTHFARLLREYEGLDLEICRSESEVAGYILEDLSLEQLKTERLHLKDALIAMVQ